MARDGHRARRHRRSRLGHPAAPAHLGGVGPPESFTDPLVDCRACGQRFRADQLEDNQCPQKPSVHPGEGPNCDLTEARQFNLMLQTSLGPVRDEGSIVYLRPETAQGIFANFKNVLQTSRRKPPFGIAQIGKSFRNEITTKQFIFRTREFEQMEMEFFVPPPDAEKWFLYWLDARERWYLELGTVRGPPAPAPARPGRALALLDRDERHRVPLSHRLAGARGHREPRRLRPPPARAVLGREARVLRPGNG